MSATVGLVLLGGATCPRDESQQPAASQPPLDDPQLADFDIEVVCPDPPANVSPEDLATRARNVSIALGLDLAGASLQIDQGTSANINTTNGVAFAEPDPNNPRAGSITFLEGAASVVNTPDALMFVLAHELSHLEVLLATDSPLRDAHLDFQNKLRVATASSNEALRAGQAGTRTPEMFADALRDALEARQAELTYTKLLLAEEIRVFGQVDEHARRLVERGLVDDDAAEVIAARMKEAGTGPEGEIPRLEKRVNELDASVRSLERDLNGAIRENASVGPLPALGPCSDPVIGHALQGDAVAQLCIVKTCDPDAGGTQDDPVPEPDPTEPEPPETDEPDEPDDVPPRPTTVACSPASARFEGTVVRQAGIEFDLAGESCSAVSGFPPLDQLVLDAFDDGRFGGSGSNLKVQSSSHGSFENDASFFFLDGLPTDETITIAFEDADATTFELRFVLRNGPEGATLDNTELLL